MVWGDGIGWCMREKEITHLRSEEWGFTFYILYYLFCDCLLSLLAGLNGFLRLFDVLVIALLGGDGGATASISFVICRRDGFVHCISVPIVQHNFKYSST